MSGMRKQAGFGVFAGLALLLAGYGAEAAQAVYKPDTPVAPKSLDDLMPDLLAEKASGSAKSVKPATDAAPEQPNITPSATAAPSLPLNEAKAADGKTAAAPVAPEAPKTGYRIYSAPKMAEDEDVSPKAPDPMGPLDVAADGLPAAGMGDKNTPLLTVRNMQEAAEPATITSQYFPLLPLSASEDTIPQLMPLASNHEIAGDHRTVARAIIFIHDMARNASEGVTALTTLAGGENERTLVLAPQFPLGIDVARFAPHLPDGGRSMARWSLIDPLRSWQIGGDSVTGSTQPGISSFTALDLLLLYLADKNSFPQLQQVVIAGHGMGADFVLRYAATGKAPDLLKEQKIGVRFLAANANSYLYLTEARPVKGQNNFAPPASGLCPNVNDYPYGTDRLTPYARRLGANAIRMQYPERRVMVLMSDKIPGDSLLDDNCAAMAQGKNRLERGRNFERYLSSKFGETARAVQDFAVVPGGGYDPVALFGSYCGMAVLYRDGECLRH